MTMRIFLLQSVNKIGKSGDLVNVKDGYARNFLIPRGLAAPVTKGTQKQIEEQKKHLSLSLAREEKRAVELKSKIEALELVIPMQAGKGNKVYGAITNQLIQKHLKENGVVLDRKKIHINDPINKLGQYQVPIKLSSNVDAVLKLSVSKL